MTDALTERVARAIFRATFHERDSDELVQQKWNEWHSDRERMYRYARAAISAISSDVETMRSALEKCRDRFREYEASHRSKYENTGCEVNERKSRKVKAARNREMAELCESALTSIATNDQRDPDLLSTIERLTTALEEIATETDTICDFDGFLLRDKARDALRNARKAYEGSGE